MADQSIYDRQLRADAMLRTYSADQGQTPRERAAAAIADLLFYVVTDPQEVLAAGVQEFASQLAREDPLSATRVDWIPGASGGYVAAASRMIESLLGEDAQIPGLNVADAPRETAQAVHSRLMRMGLGNFPMPDADNTNFGHVEDMKTMMSEASKIVAEPTTSVLDTAQVAPAVAESLGQKASAASLSFPVGPAQQLAHSQQSAASGSGDELQRPAHPALGGHSAQGETGR